MPKSKTKWIPQVFMINICYLSIRFEFRLLIINMIINRLVTNWNSKTVLVARKEGGDSGSMEFPLYFYECFPTIRWKRGKQLQVIGCRWMSVKSHLNLKPCSHFKSSS